MEEAVYMDEPGLTVTSTRIVLGGQTFATRNVGSVKVKTIGRPMWPALAVIVGLLSFAGGDAARGFGVLLLIVGAIAAWMKRPKQQLVLLTGGGEQTAYESRNKGQVQQVHDAIVQAISIR